MTDNCSVVDFIRAQVVLVFLYPHFILSWIII